MQKVLDKIKEQYTTYYSFVIVPYDHKRYFEFKVKKLFAHIILSALIILGCYTLGVTIINQVINRNIDENTANITVLKETNQKQREHIFELEEQLDIMNKKLTELEALETYIKDIVDYEEKKQE